MSLATRAAAVALVAGVAIALTPPAAHAKVQTFSAGRYQLVAGPVVAGAATAWAGPLGESGYRLFERRGGATVLLRTAPAGGVRLQPTLAGSDAVLAVQEAQFGPDTENAFPYLASRTFAKTAGQAGLTPLAPSCEAPEGLCPRGIAVSGTRVLYPIDPGSAGSRIATAGLRDLASPSPAVARIADVGFGLAMAGSVAAWSTSVQVPAPDDAIVVYDLANGRELYRLAISEPKGLAIQPDGKIAFIGSNRRLVWASPQEPYPHPVAGAEPSGYTNFRLHDDVLTWARDENRKGRFTGHRSILTAPLRGSARRLVTGVKGGFDTDGNRVAWSGRSCDGATISSESYVRLLRRPVNASKTCRLRLVRRPRPSREGIVTINPRCDGFSPNCDVKVRSIRAARSYAGNGIRIRRGQRLAVVSRLYRDRAKLTRPARRLLRSRRAIRATIQLEIGGDGVGTDETRRGTFTIRR